MSARAAICARITGALDAHYVPYQPPGKGLWRDERDRKSAGDR